MLTLPQSVLAGNTSAIDGAIYQSTQLSAGIAHIGAGDLAWTHPAYYTSRLLNLSNQTNWGIRVISLLATDESIIPKFAIDSSAVIDHLTASADREKIIACLIDPAIKIVSLALTKAGYNLDEAGHVGVDNPSVDHDLTTADQSQTAFDYLTEALGRRRAQAIGPFTILSCDDLPRNGEAIKKALLSFVTARDADLANWINEQVAFPNSVIVAPIAEETQLSVEADFLDALSSYREKLSDWVIENYFCSDRPDWEIAGVTFVDDITPYELLKQRFQNASYSLLAYPAFLAGYRTTHDAISDNVFSNYVDIFINRLVSSLVTLPESVNLPEYKEKLLGRLSAAVVPNPLTQLCADGAIKLPAFILPILAELVEQNKPTYCIAFLLASYGHYLQSRTDDKGVEYSVNDPHLNEEDWAKINDPDVLTFLDISPFTPADLRTIPHFAAAYKLYRKQIAIYGVSFTLRQTMCTFLELH